MFEVSLWLSLLPYQYTNSIICRFAMDEMNPLVDAIASLQSVSMEEKMHAIDSFRKFPERVILGLTA
jgi:hypothetical protein